MLDQASVERIQTILRTGPSPARADTVSSPFQISAKVKDVKIQAEGETMTEKFDENSSYPFLFDGRLLTAISHAPPSCAITEIACNLFVAAELSIGKKTKYTNGV